MLLFCIKHDSHITVHIIILIEERVDIRYLSLLKYNDGTGEKELRIQEQIVLKWKELAKQLGCSAALIELWSQKDPQQATEAMMNEWLRRDPKNSWRKLVQKMKDAGLVTPAADLEHALHHMITQD